MAKIPADMRLQTEQLIEDGEIEGELRPYLGISGIADKCARKLWYGFRLCVVENISPRQDRLFSRGHNEEPIIIKDLEKIGIRVYGDQDEVISGNGHIKGHCDGKGDNIPDAPKTTHLLEFKTANDANFKKYKKVKSVKKVHTVYYGQLVCYMFLLGLKRALFIVVNKNNDERYYERVEADNEYAKELLQRGFDIISTEIPPEKMSTNPSWFECKWCKYSDICHFDGSINETCRTCSYCDICDDGVWECSRYGIELAFSQQKKACSRYSKMENLK